jgi:hypothetical protein
LFTINKLIDIFLYTRKIEFTKTPLNLLNCIRGKRGDADAIFINKLGFGLKLIVYAVIYIYGMICNGLSYNLT